jgi:hypothetical protein
MQAQALLDGEGLPVRVVSMPSTSVFDRQDQAWRDLPGARSGAAGGLPRGGRRRGRRRHRGGWGEAPAGCAAALGGSTTSALRRRVRSSTPTSASRPRRWRPWCAGSWQPLRGRCGMTKGAALGRRRHACRNRARRPPRGLQPGLRSHAACPGAGTKRTTASCWQRHRRPRAPAADMASRSDAPAAGASARRWLTELHRRKTRSTPQRVAAGAGAAPRCRRADRRGARRRPAPGHHHHHQPRQRRRTAVGLHFGPRLARDVRRRRLRRGRRAQEARPRGLPARAAGSWASGRWTRWPSRTPPAAWPQRSPPTCRWSCTRSAYFARRDDRRRDRHRSRPAHARRLAPGAARPRGRADPARRPATVAGAGGVGGAALSALGGRCIVGPA